jgi:hypothetical protein
MAAGTTHTDFHVNLQYFSNEQIKFPATFAVISITGFTGSRAPVASRRGKHRWHPAPVLPPSIFRCLRETHVASHPHISSGIDACGNCTLNISERVVQQHFVVTDVNAGGRHAVVSTVKGRSQWMSRVGAP